MTQLGLFLIIIGLAIAITRAPLIFAPEGTRAVYLKVVGNEKTIRFLGLFVGLLGLWAIIVGRAAAGNVAQIVAAIGYFGAAAGIVWMGIFPRSASKIASRIFNSFSPASLRVAGALAVAFGLWIAWYGTSI